MTSDFPAIVDACVLVQAAVRDTLLKVFERRLFLARCCGERRIRFAGLSLLRAPE
jgi:hypothetical protein